jgi:TolA-binding protein
LVEKEVSSRRMTLYIGHNTEYETLDWLKSRKNRSSEIIEIIQKYVTGDIGDIGELEKKILKLENKIHKLKTKNEALMCELQENKESIKKMLEEALKEREHTPTVRQEETRQTPSEQPKEEVMEESENKKIIVESTPKTQKTNNSLFKGLSNGKEYKSKGKGLKELP